MVPEERTLRRHIEEGPFRAGLARDEWRPVSEIAFPHILIAVRAAPRLGSPDEVVLRFELSGYPQSPPTAQPWDAALQQPLAHDLWPTGGQASEVFNPGWNAQALYLPFDRLAIPGHDVWANQAPSHIWHAGRTITDYLRLVYRVLQRADYQGVRRAAA
jgi:hypothetical protein